MDQPYGRARQASWGYLLALLVGAVLVAVAITWAYMQIKYATEA